MAIKNLLVAYNGTESSNAALDAAIFMRQKYDAHLTGLLARDVESGRQSATAWIPKNIQDMVREAREKEAEAVHQEYVARTESVEDADKIHWISKYGEADATVSRYARLFDLTIAGRFDAVLDETDTALHPDKIAMISGRPVLLVPRENDMSTYNEHAVVAWDGKRASARALADAMQILETKSLVTVITVEDSGSDINLPEMDIETALVRHGVKTEFVKLKKDGRSVGDNVLEFLDRAQPKLLVMGAYEHSKFRQYIVGGVTNKVLKKAKIPVLISH